MTYSEACPDASTEQEQWTEAQATAGTCLCYTCKTLAPCRIEPFSNTPNCKKCWELIVYGEEA